MSDLKHAAQMQLEWYYKLVAGYVQ